MRASFTFQQLINNRGLRSFFMRDQAYKTLEELCERSDMYMEDVAEIIDNFYEEEQDFDDIEEMFYSESVEEIADILGIELEEEEEDEE